MTYSNINGIAGCMDYGESLLFFFFASTDTISRHNDAKEQDLRYRSFNVKALIERALKAKRERADGLTCISLSPSFHSS